MTGTTAAADISLGAADPGFGPWNPGIESRVPEKLRHLCTILRPENVFTGIAAARELRDLTGLELSELVVFRPQRLALHELLIRVTADISVPDGARIGDLGINFREIARALLARHIEPRMNEVSAAYETVRHRVSGLIASELDALFPPAADVSAALRLVEAWEAKAGEGVQRAAYRALAKVVSALLVRHGRLWGSRELVASLAAGVACNDAGSEEIGRVIEPWLARAAASEGYRLLPRQEHPVVMNTKGPSASGKSSLRPLQRTLAGSIGVGWSEFSYVSPDIWRKQLLDYDSLGAAYKYAGAFTAEELRIVDLKLDRYMARKAERGAMSHLLIDRFRFDSFAPDSGEAGSNLLTRFGHVVYLFFMITPPGSLVERAWTRGLEFGRYKAVDDTLAHGVEAYSGMPQLFFTWVQRADKRVHFEFLDNSVALGERPRTVAFGWNDVLNVLDMKGMLDVERFRRVNIDATAPAALWTERDLLAGQRNTGFLRQCVERFREVNFATRDAGRVYLRLESGAPVWIDREALEEAARDPDIRAGLMAAAPASFDRSVPLARGAQHLRVLVAAERIHTLGSWGTAAS